MLNVFVITETTSLDENATYEIINSLGQGIKNGGLSTNGIDVSDLKSGIYFIKIFSNGQTVSKKFIKK
jgi:hypothetical protein